MTDRSDPEEAGLSLARRDVRAWIGVAVLVAAALRLWRLGANALWVDELATLFTARHSLSEIPRVALQGDAFAPPLYFWVAHLVAAGWGESEAALRAVSAVAGIVTVPLVWRLVRELGGGEPAAVLAASILAVNPLHLWYSQDARPYALLVALGLAALLCLQVALREGAARYWAAYACLGALALLTHATAVIFPAIGLVWVLLHQRRRHGLPRYLLASAGMLVLIFPFLLALGQAVLHAGGTGSPPRPLTGLEIPYTLFTFLAGYSFGPAVREVQDLGWTAAVRAHPVQTAIVIGALLAAAGAAVRLRCRAAARLGVLLAVPLLATFAGALVTTKAYNVRYALPALAGFMGLLGLALTSLRPRQRALGAALVLALSLWADLQWFRVPRYWKEDSRAAVACLRRVMPQDATVLVAPAYMAQVLGYYAARAGAAIQPLGLDEPGDLAQRPPSAALALTRLHHVPRAEELVRAFDRTGAGPVASAEVTGYRILFRTAGGEAATAACGADT